MRYSDYCQKVGHAPQWSNVHTGVEVNIVNKEFGEISTKEVELAKYLDMLQTVQVTNYLYIDDTLSYEKIIDIGQIGVPSAINVQEAKTNLMAEYQED